jgi:hypothetical protein
MDVQFDVLRSLVMHRVVRQVNRGDIITKDDIGLVDGDMKFVKKIPQLAALSSGICDPPVLSFRR